MTQENINIKECLKQKYILAESFYLRKDYSSYLSTIRYALEAIPQLMIEDILSEEDYEDFLNGYTDIILNKHLKDKPTGKLYALNLPQCYFYVFDEINANKTNKEIQSLRHDFESYSEALIRYWGYCSALLHTGVPKFDVRIQAISCKHFIPSFFDFVKTNKIVSSNLIDFFSELNRVSEQTTIDEETEKLHQIQKLNQLVSEINKSLQTAQQEKSIAETELADNKASHAEEILSKNELIEELKSQLEQQQSVNLKLQEELVRAERQRLEAEKIALEAMEEAERIKSENAVKSIVVTDEEVNNESVILKAELSEDSSNKEEASLAIMTETSDRESKTLLFENPDQKQAYELAQKGLSPIEIKNQCGWSPSYTYSCLTALIEEGKLTADTFLDEETYQSIMESIDKYGSDAEERKIRDNCQLIVALWQVKMVLAELKYTGQTIDADEDIAAKEFAEYILNCFHIERHKCFSVIPTDVDSFEPDIVIELSAYRQTRTFSISVYFEADINAESFPLSVDFLKGYRSYQKKIDGPSFFIIGKGGKTNQPEKIYIFPLRLFKKEKALYYDDLEKYLQDKNIGEFKYNINTDELLFI